MLLLPTEKYIFDESSRLNFYDKLETFQEYFVDKMLMMGVSANGSDVKQINFEILQKSMEDGVNYSRMTERFKKVK